MYSLGVLSSRARRCDFPRSEAEGISGGDQCLCGNESGLGGDCGPMVPTIPLSSQPESSHAPVSSSPEFPGQSAHPLEAWFGFLLPGPQPLPVAATVRQARALEAHQAQCLTVAPGNSHFRERAQFFLLTGRTREPEFRGSATRQQLVSLLYGTGWPACRPTPRQGLWRSYGCAAREERRREPVLAAGAREH